MVKKKIAIIVGARPNFLKAAPLLKLLEGNKRFKYILIHTGQHYDYEMSRQFFEELNMPEPHYNLGLQSNKYPFTTQIALMKRDMEKIFIKEKIDLCLVFGDTNSAIAGALAAKERVVKLGHIEAGLRSFDRTMSEETNRLVIDSLSDYLFTSEESANKNLINEGHSKKKIFFVGNIMIDTLVQNIDRIPKSPTGEYGVVTLHRYNNIDVPSVLKEITEAILEIHKKLEIIWINHPNKDLSWSKPLPYLKMLSFIKGAKIVLTDSGGIQEETTYLGVPCLTLRNNTERPVTVSMGTNIIAGTSKDSILNAFNYMMSEDSKGIISTIPPKWDGKTSERILKVLEKVAQ